MFYFSLVLPVLNCCLNALTGSFANHANNSCLDPPFGLFHLKIPVFSWNETNLHVDFSCKHLPHAVSLFPIQMDAAAGCVQFKKKKSIQLSLTGLCSRWFGKREFATFLHEKQTEQFDVNGKRSTKFIHRLQSTTSRCSPPPPAC